MASFYDKKGEFKDFYRLLGVSSKASGEEIKTAFENRVKEFQLLQERNFGMIEGVVEAFSILGDVEAKSSYDLEYKSNLVEEEPDCEPKPLEEMDREKLLSELREARKRLSALEEKTENEDKRIDVKDLYVCLYDWGKIGFFKGERFMCNIKEYALFSTPDYDSGLKFTGLTAPYLAIVYDHYHSGNTTNCNIFWTDRFAPTGKRIKMDSKIVVTNCRIQYYMTVDEMRQIMFTAGDIPDLNLGSATEEELKEILKYAKAYYQPILDKELDAQRRKDSAWSI